MQPLHQASDSPVTRLSWSSFPLRKFTIANSNHTVQTRALHAYQRRRNANARRRDVLAAERKEPVRIRSEKGIRWGGRPISAAACPGTPTEPLLCGGDA